MTSSAQEIYTILVRRIIRDHYPREKALPSERDIADEFETSRTVIRGVLKRLESEKYVEMVSPRKRRISSAGFGLRPRLETGRHHRSKQLACRAGRGTVHQPAANPRALPAA